GDRKPRFNDDRRSDRPRTERDSERKPYAGDKPRFERDGDRKPRFNDDRRSDRPRTERDGERKPYAGDKPRFERDGDRKPRFNDDLRSDRPRTERDGERKPYAGDKPRFERGSQHDRQARSNDSARSSEKPRFNREEGADGQVRFVRQEQSARPVRESRPRGDKTLSLKREAAATETEFRTVPSDFGIDLDLSGIPMHNDIDMEQIRRQRAEETRIYGENACQMLFAKRPEAIVRGWFTQQATTRFSDTLRWMAQNRKAYHLVDDQELNKVAGSDHHGGVCLLIKKREPLSLTDYLVQPRESDCLLALEDVGNPHNLGGIMRSCAHFGVDGVVMRNAGMLESGAAVRTAEGGAEYLQPINTEDFAAGLDQLRRAGYTIVTTSSHQGQSVFSTELPAKVVIVFGEERSGISADTQAQGDLALSIPGTGHVESLNVSVATGVLLAEWWRQHGVKAKA
ncbi:MAG: tRNA/rRNA methyltransferase, partial [Plesiomonas sp.]